MRLEFEIDSEVYPELHAALSALKSTRARAERLRQLAAAGLVWEKVRLHGTGVAIEPAARAEPAPAPAPPARPERRARPSRHDVEQAIRELPVLMDVVADVRPLHEAGDTLREEPAHWAAMSAYPDDIADTGAARGDDGDALADLPDPTLHVSALAHKPATRSRLMRMKERGLFKNG